MAGEGEAIGDLVTGGLFARTVDRPTESAHAHDPHAPHGACLNCGTALIGSHCHACGQEAHLHRSLGAIGHDLLHGVLHLEGRFWSTLPMLLFRPGELTRRYIHGERKKFVSPMAFFLFSVFAMFAVLSILGIAPPTDMTNAGAQGAAAVKQIREDALSDLGSATRRRDDPKSSAVERAEAIDDIKQARTTLAELKSAEGVFGTAPEVGRNFNTGWHRLDKGLEKATKNPGLALYKLQANSYKFSWLLIPLSIPFVWMMFAWRREFDGYDHAVFVTYSLAFMSLLFILLTIMGAAGVPIAVVATLATFVPVFHMYRQLRGAYRLGRVNALVRTSVLLVMVQVVIVLFSLAVLGLGLIG